MASSSDKKLFDVAKPGRTPADPTSRPIISTNPLVPDPMVRIDDNDDAKPKSQDTATAGQGVPLKGNKVIAPLSEAEKQAAGDLSGQAEPVNAADDDTTGPVASDEADNQSSGKDKKHDESDALTEQQQQVEKLIAEKKYFVPIGNAKISAGKKAVPVAAAIVALVACAVAYVLLKNGI